MIESANSVVVTYIYWEGKMVSDNNHIFQCMECKCVATLSTASDGSLTQLACKTTNCLYEDTPYDQSAILHVMLDASSLASYHEEIRQVLDKRQASQPQRPYMFRLVS